MTETSADSSKDGERRMFRESLHELLDVIKSDVGLGETFLPDFHEYEPEEIDETTAGLREIFEFSGLSIDAPGHWQLLLIAVLNCYVAPAPRAATRWTRENERLFVHRVVCEREGGSTLGVEKLCEELKTKFPTDYPAVAATLRSEFQRITREMKSRVGGGYDKDGTDAALLRRLAESKSL